jgi:transcriptional regulator with XRE-family HTH domain
MHETLKRMRKTCKISQVRIGTLLGLNQAGVSRIENGSQQVSIEWLMSLANFYQVDLECLISGRVNYWELAKRFNVKVPLPKKYLGDQQAVVREVLPLLQHFSNLYQREVVSEFLEELGLQDILLIDPSERISVHCFYDILKKAIEKKLVSLGEVPKIIDLAFTSFDQLPFNRIYAGFENTPDLIQAWVLNSSFYEGFFSHKIEKVQKNEQILSLKICNELRSENFKADQVDQFIMDYKINYMENLPAHFGHRSIDVDILENPFESSERIGRLKLSS